ncbi:hypothetical protein LPJ59_003100 [Coemansia sp. RSA 2399]|nr:hypothetical protein LPJ59_003100 [Coemansia sp. RSA 2399]KAJ1903986.1 hypothetical protein LPJ81_002761 [Coemansia sp. IMI 209127]
MADPKECALQRDELTTSKLWINELKSRYLECVQDNAKDLPTDLQHFPATIHAYIDHYQNMYAQNREALTAYRAREILAERINGAAFIPSSSELDKLEMSVDEEERLLERVQQRISEKVREMNEKIDAECKGYEEALDLAHRNEELEAEVGGLEAELNSLTRALEEKEQKERDVVEQQTRDLQAAHNELLRETAMRDEIQREQARLEDRLAQLKSEDQRRRMTALDSQEQQKAVERWIKTIAPVVSARVEGSTLVLTIGDGLGAMSNRRILARFNELGNVEDVRTDDGRKLPADLDHNKLMRLLSE